MDRIDGPPEESDPQPSADFLAFVRDAMTKDSDGSLTRFLELSPDDAALVLACAAARRVEALCRALFGGPYLSARVQGDEYLYQGLRTNLLTLLDQSAEFAEARNIVLAELSPTLPHDPEPMYDMDWQYGIEPACRKLNAELMRLAITRRVSPFEPGPDLFFDPWDKAIAVAREIIAKAERKFAAEHGLPIPGMANSANGKATTDVNPPTAGDQRRAPRRQGRIPVCLPYKTAQRVWWELTDDSAPGKPTQQDFCDRLTALGFPMSPRTLRDRIGAWRQGGLVWEPPRPAD